MARATIDVIRQAGVDVGMEGKEEVCCNGRAYEVKRMLDPNSTIEPRKIWRHNGLKAVLQYCLEDVINRSRGIMSRGLI